MKHSVLFAAGLAVCLFLLLPYPIQAYDYSYARVVRLSLVEGDVQITRSDEKGWEQAIANMPIEQGFTIGTNNGRAEIEFESGATAYIAENTVLQFTELALSNGGRITKLTLTQGTATFYARLASDDSFAILTPNVQVTIPRRAEVRLDVFKDGTSVSAPQGEADADSPAGTKTIEKGQTLGFSADAPDQVRTQRNPAPDDWDRWVDNHEGSINTGTAHSLQYTSAPFQYGMSDLSQYGGWNYYPGYGFGWQPWNLWIGWAPFNFGRWCFYPGLGWTWVSYEPWGWVPYHFGSWVFSPAFGWVWLPGLYNYWCPAPVQWLRVGNRIGWTPLRPVNQAGAPASLAPKVPVVISGSNQLGGMHKNKILAADTAASSPNNKMEILGAPPSMNGKLPRISAGQELHAEKPVSVVPGTATAGFQSGITALVPTSPSVTRSGSTIVYDPAERRYVNNNPATTPSAAPSTTKAIEDGTTSGVPVAPSNVSPMPNQPPNPLPPSATPRVFTPPPVRSVPPPPRPIVASPSLHTNGSAHSPSAPIAPAPHVSAPAPHSSAGGHPH